MWILTGEKVSKVQNSVLADSVLHGLSPSNARGGAGGGSILSEDGGGEWRTYALFSIFDLHSLRQKSLPSDKWLWSTYGMDTATNKLNLNSHLQSCRPKAFVQN